MDFTSHWRIVKVLARHAMVAGKDPFSLKYPVVTALVQAQVSDLGALNRTHHCCVWILDTMGGNLHKVIGVWVHCFQSPCTHLVHIPVCVWHVSGLDCNWY